MVTSSDLARKSSGCLRQSQYFMRLFERTVDELAHDVRLNSEQIEQFASCPIRIRRRHYQSVGVVEERIPKRSSIGQTEVIAGFGGYAARRFNSQVNFPPKICTKREGGREPFRVQQRCTRCTE